MSFYKMLQGHRVIKKQNVEDLKKIFKTAKYNKKFGFDLNDKRTFIMQLPMLNHQLVDMNLLEHKFRLDESEPGHIDIE